MSRAAGPGYPRPDRAGGGRARPDRAPARWRRPPGRLWLGLWVGLVFLALSGPAPVAARDPAVSDPGLEEPTGGGEAARGRILAQVNEPASPAGRLERLAAAIPPGDVVSGLEHAINPQVLKLFGGPGLDPAALSAAVNYDLRQGGRPHLVLAAGLAAHAALAGIERVRLPGLRLGPMGPGYGLGSRSSRVRGGVYLAPPASPGAPFTRGMTVKIKGCRLPGGFRSGIVERMELALAGEERPDPRRPTATGSVRLVVPLATGRLGAGLGVSVTVVRAGAERSHVMGLAPSFTAGRFQVAGEIRRVDTGATTYHDLALRAALKPIRASIRLRQAPRPGAAPSFDLRLEVLNLAPELGL